MLMFAMPLSAEAATWEEWSNTDVTAFWNLEGGNPARSRVTVTPTGDAQFGIQVPSPDARLPLALSISASAQGGDDPHLGAVFRLEVPAIVENLTPFAAERFVGPDGPLMEGDQPTLFRAVADQSGHRRRYQTLNAVGVGPVWNVTGLDGQRWEYHDHVDNRWLLTRHTDRFGNAIDYDYDAGGRVTTILYGGAIGRFGQFIEPAEIQVSFDYEDRLCTRTDLRNGSVHDKRLARITVSVDDDVVRILDLGYHDDCPDRLATVIDTGFDLLSALDNSRTWHFDYGSSPGFTTDVWDVVPGQLHQSISTYAPNGLSGEAHETVMQAGGGNGDPLVDVIGPAGIVWGHELKRWDVPEHSFTSDVDEWGTAFGGVLGRTVPISAPVDPEGERRILSRGDTIRTVDFDTDGFDDRLVSSAAGLRIQWGGSEGSETFAAWPTAHTSAVLLAETRQVARWSGLDEQSAIQTADLVDWNGDGYLDVVGMFGANLSVTKWNPTAEAWDSEIFVDAPWCIEEGWPFCGMKRSDTVRQFGSHWDSLGHVTAGLMDLNGDRLPDMVIARGEDDWRVFFGTPTTFQPGIDLAGAFPESILATRETWDFQHDGEGIGTSETFLAPGDVDADGLVDFIWLNNGFADVFRNTGDIGGTYFDHSRILAPFDVLSLTSTERSIVEGGVDFCCDGDCGEIPACDDESDECFEDCVDRDCEDIDPDDLEDCFDDCADEGEGCAEACYDDAAECMGRTRFEDVSTVLVDARDWTGDGSLDVMDTRTGEVHIGAWPGPTLLTNITFDAGETDLEWRTAAEAFPSGFFGLYEQENHQGIPTLHVVTERDLVTGDEWSVTHSFQYGVWDPVRRRFLGFGEEDVDDTTGHHSTYMRHTSVPLAGLDYDVYHGTTGGIPLLQIGTNYELVGPPGVVLPVTETVTQRGLSTTRSKRAVRSYDVHGNLIALQLRGESFGPIDTGLNDTIVAFKYASNGSPPSRVEPCVIQTGRVGRQGMIVMQERRITYDNNGPCEVGDAITAVEVDRSGDGLISEPRGFDVQRNAFGQPEIVTGVPSGTTTSYDYDETFRFADTTTNDVGHVTRQTLDAWGRARRTVAPTGVVVETERDGFGRATAVYRSSPTVARQLISTAEYSDGAQPSSTQRTFVFDPFLGELVQDAISTAYQDAWGDTVQTRTQVGAVEHIVSDVAYLPNGKVGRVGVPRTATGSAYDGFGADFWQSTEYDDIGRFASTTDALGNTTVETAVDPWDSALEDAEGFTNRKRFDHRGRVVEAWAERNGEVLPGAIYRYDELGRVTSITDPDGVVTSYFWSSVGELLRIESEDIGWRAYGYDDDGRLVDQTDSEGRRVHYIRDGIGRILQKEEGFGEFDLEVVEVYHWDTQLPGLLDAVDDAAGRVDYTYDGLGRVLSEQRRFPDGGVAARTMTWDDQDRLVGEDNPDGVDVRWFFRFGRTSGFEVTAKDGTKSGAGMRYGERGRYDGYEYDHGPLLVFHDFDRDRLGRVLRANWSVPVPGRPTIEHQHQFRYRPNGLVRRRNVGRGETIFDHDPAGRIDVATGHGAGFYDFSAGGTPSFRSLSNGAANVEDKTYVTRLGSHQVEVVDDAVIGRRFEYEFDGAGNVTSLTRYKNAALQETLAFDYDGLGRPVTVTSSTGVVMRRFYAHDGAVVYEEIDGKAIRRMGSWERIGADDRTTVRFAGEILGRWSKGKIFEFVATDPHGTPTLVVNNKGKVVQSLDLDVYGAQISPDGQVDIGADWLGVATSAKLGLASTGTRLYDQRARMFLTPDPALMAMDGGLALRDPYGTNPYAYGRWNGADLHDRSGAYAESPWDAFSFFVDYEIYQYNPTDANAAALGVDAAALAVPFVPSPSLPVRALGIAKYSGDYLGRVIWEGAEELVPVLTHGLDDAAEGSAKVVDDVASSGSKAADDATEGAREAASASEGSATFHKYEGDVGPTSQHVTVEIKDASGNSLGEFHQTGMKNSTIEPVRPGDIDGTRTKSTSPFKLDDPQGAAEFGNSGFEAGRWKQNTNDCVTGACAVANWGSPTAGEIKPWDVRQQLDMR